MRTIEAVDLFAGAGGTSTGLIQAVKDLGYELHLTAINHWEVAISTHSLNHPGVGHLCSDLNNVNPHMVVPGGYLDLLVASPECTHHSNARGGKPMDEQSRAGAEFVTMWAEKLYIENILIENVKEFMTWGPLDRNRRPIEKLKGQLFLNFIDRLKALDYNVEFRVINAANYGDATTRERLFILARKNGKRIDWPEISHSKDVEMGFLSKTRKWRPAKEIIDWSVKGTSIFDRKRPLKENTMRRIMKGLEKFGGNSYIVTTNWGLTNRSIPRSVEEPIPTIVAQNNHLYLCEPYIVMMYGNSDARSIERPLPTVTAKSNHLYLCEPFIFALNHGKDDARSYSVEQPMPTITTVDAWGLAQPFLVKYNSNSSPLSIEDPLATITGKDRFGLVVPKADGSQALVDVLFRMLTPKELAAAMSFPADYVFTGPRDAQVKQIGNAVPVKTAKALCKSLLMDGEVVE